MCNSLQDLGGESLKRREEKPRQSLGLKSGHKELSFKIFCITSEAFCDFLGVFFNMIICVLKRIFCNKICIIIYFLPISSHKMCEASAKHILWH